jgi:hypothetical protein
VISIGALTPIRFVETTRRLRHLQIPTTSATAPFGKPPAYGGTDPRTNARYRVGHNFFQDWSNRARIIHFRLTHYPAMASFDFAV